MRQSNAYSLTSKILHWCMAYLFLIMFLLAYCMLNMPKIPLRMTFYDWHKATGILLLMFLVIRATARVIHTKKKHFLPLWQKMLSQLTVTFLYLIMLLMPITGFLTSTLGGHDITFYYLITFKPLTHDAYLSAWFSNAHRIISYGMLFFVGLHIVGAFYHRWVIKDDVFASMRLL